MTHLLSSADIHSPEIIKFIISKNVDRDCISIHNFLFLKHFSFFKVCLNSKLSRNFGLTLRMVLKFYTSVAKRLKLKIRKFKGLISTFVEVTGEKW